jgi:hypothetical protein
MNTKVDRVVSLHPGGSTPPFCLLGTPDGFTEGCPEEQGVKHPSVPPVVLIIGAWNYPIHLTLASYLGDEGIFAAARWTAGSATLN